jgi:hypothetical protein
MNMSDSPERRQDTSDASACLARVAGLPLANVRVTHQELLDLLAAMSRNPPPAAAYLDVLEAARGAVVFVQDKLALRYAARPLPPLPGEEEAFQQVLALWQAMARAYAQVAQLGGNDASVQQRMALICHRCIYYAGRIILEHYRSRREPGKGSWIDLHGYYATAEEWDLAATAVAEPLNDVRKSQSCHEAYATILLIDLANPYSRSTREFGWIVRWAQRFAPFTAVLPLGPGGKSRAYGVDLMLDSAARPLENLQSRESVRCFDTSRLARKIQQLFERLKKNIPPEALGLGDDCTGADASRQLVLLYRPWCLNATPRRFQRRASSGIAQACLGFEAIHYRLSGSEFNQPEHVRTYSRDDMERIWTFRDQIDPTQQLKLRTAQLGFPLEDWDVVDQSVSGFRLRRGSAGARIAHGQLFCLKPPDGGHFLLAQVCWLMLEAGGGLLAGVQVLPGVPQGIAIRPTGATVSRSEHYLRAFVLPALPALKEPDSLVAPHGWFQPGRIIEIFTDREVRVRLNELLARGADFERISFTRL